MSLAVTIAIAVAAALLGALCGWMGARPPDPARGPRLVPWRFLMIFCAAVVLYMIVHLVNLAGVKTGGPSLR